MTDSTQYSGFRPFVDPPIKGTGGFFSSIRVTGFLALWIALIFATVQAAETTLTIGYLELDKDSRYKKERMDARFQAQPWGRPFEGAQVAVKEARFVGSAIGVDFKLQRVTGRDAGELALQAEGLLAQGVHSFLVDAPANVMIQLADRFNGKDVLLFNLSALDNSLRQTECRKNMLHIAPSESMLMDALTQYLITQKWRKMLVLQGPRPEDKDLVDALQRAKKRFGLKIVDVRPFKLGLDPRQRSRNNIALLTSGTDYDVVFVADTDGEFARAVPYQVQKPRPVVGSAGMVPDWWHWAWERHGAPQLNKRFYRKAKRRMTGYDWSAWMAVKVIVEAVQRTKATDFNVISDFIRSEDIVLDGFKGYRLNFRAWNNQLRQPIFVTTTNWVVERAPLDGFLHQTNNLDTLGFDERETKCEM